MQVQQQRDQIPRCTTEPGGQGVSAQRVAVHAMRGTEGRQPYVGNTCGGSGVPTGSAWIFMEACLTAPA